MSHALPGGLSLREVEEALKAINDGEEAMPLNRPPGPPSVICLGPPPPSSAFGPRPAHLGAPPGQIPPQQGQPQVPQQAPQQAQGGAPVAAGGQPAAPERNRPGGNKATGAGSNAYCGALVFNVDPTRPLKVLGEWGKPQAPFWNDRWFIRKNWLDGEVKTRKYELTRLRIKRAWWYFPPELVRAIVEFLVTHKKACSPRLAHWVPWLQFERFLPEDQKILSNKKNFHRTFRQMFPKDPSMGVRMELVTMELQMKFQFGSRILAMMKRMFEIIQYYLETGNIPPEFSGTCTIYQMVDNCFFNLMELSDFWRSRSILYEQMWYHPPPMEHHPAWKCQVYDPLRAKCQPCNQDPQFCEISPWTRCFNDRTLHQNECWPHCVTKWIWGEEDVPKDIDLEEIPPTQRMEVRNTFFSSCSVH